MAQTGRTAPPAPAIDRQTPFALSPIALLPGPPEGLPAIEAALARGAAEIAEALSALDRASRLIRDQRWLLESLAAPAASAAERLAAMRGFATARARLRAVCDGIALLDGSLPRGLRVITGLDGGAISIAPHDIRPALAAIAEAPSPRLAAAMLAPEGPLAQAARAVAVAQRRLAADQRRLRNRQSLNAALALAWGDGSAPPPPSLLQRLTSLLRGRALA
ncbi:MAG: hypothetical protein MUC89_15770 [Acetobacteraceae bacterium]|jgi:hypothetical protein|nr:hypothetical protein [Acetobacteraceae bacterium]